MVRALIAQGSGSNVAATDPTDDDRRLAPPVLPMPLTQAAAHLTATVKRLSRWKILGTSDSVIWATRSTRLFRFTDDIVILLVPLGDSTRVEARSSSRLGKGDLGQNRRNLAELWGAALIRPAGPSTS